MNVDARSGWTVIVPVKHTSYGKSRLGADAALARAIALDTLERIAATPRVTRIALVTSDVALADSARREIAGTRLDVVAEELSPSQVLASDAPTPIEHSLNDAVRAGLRGAADGLVAAIHADLPALHSDDLDDALRLAAHVPFGAVSDSEGRGTVMLTAQHPRDLKPSFGRDSYSSHLAAGAVPVPAAASLRRDVDTAAQLAAARDDPGLTLGRRTRSLAD